ncbi:MAG: sugar ABC transporter ATP-binding protein [Kiritimatiellaeota bacterium]|nr:sugar ABC transporter ATP-binding protein [Kiritimatiellota bacterium]
MENVLEIDGVSKSFGAAPVVNDVSLALPHGVILGLAGGNGAGKSTLMNCVAGHLAHDTGAIRVAGGVAMVPQEFKLVNELRVYENMFLGREMRRGGIFTDRRAMRRLCAEALVRINADIMPDTPVSELGVAQKQKVEIAKAMLLSSALLIMDEPTTVLNTAETETLFGILRAFRDAGGSVIFITHRLGELCALCDEVAVMRDARLVFRAPANTLTPAAIAAQMTGDSTITTEFQNNEKNEKHEKAVVLEVMRFSSGREVRDVSFAIREGEILGLAGLAGAGRTELAEALCGLRPHIGGLRAHSGEVRIAGARVRIRSMTDATRHGLAYLSEDRQATGLLRDWSVADNTVAASLPCHASRLGFIRRGECRARALEYIRAFGIKTPSPEAPVAALSGGNQQKVAIAKWLDTAPRVFIFDEPTRGVDVAARADIYAFVRTLAGRGVACLLISSDFGEIVANCPRALVMRAGRIAGELAGADVTEGNLMMLAAVAACPQTNNVV